MEGVNIMTLGAWTLGRVLTKNSKCWKKECNIKPRSSIIEKRTDSSKLEHWSGRTRTLCVAQEMETINEMMLGAWKAGIVLTNNSKCWKKECTIEPMTLIIEKRTNNSKFEDWSGRTRTTKNGNC
jgi:hypothetical protein